MVDLDIFLFFVFLTLAYALWSGSGLLASLGAVSGLFLLSAAAPFIGFFLILALLDT